MNGPDKDRGIPAHIVFLAHMLAAKTIPYCTLAPGPVPQPIRVTREIEPANDYSFEPEKEPA
jgi:hypothetical protein